MATKIGILVLHGMGSQEETFADDMISQVNGTIRDAGREASRLIWQPVHWAPTLEAREKDLWQRLSSDHVLAWKEARQFVIHSFADAIAYNQRLPNDVYDRVHACIHTNLLALREKIDPDSPLLVVAHSLGCHIISNYIWDRQKAVGEHKADPLGTTPFERFETLMGLITFGCNLPLFVLAYETVQSIAFPPAALRQPWRDLARWHNYYDKDDVLGYPLKPLSQSYDAAVSADLEINVGGFRSSWNPTSHLHYWTDRNFTDSVAHYLCRILAV